MYSVSVTRLLGNVIPVFDPCVRVNSVSNRDR